MVSAHSFSPLLRGHMASAVRTCLMGASSFINASVCVLVTPGDEGNQMQCVTVLKKHGRIMTGTTRLCLASCVLNPPNVADADHDLQTALGLLGLVYNQQRIK